MKTQIESSSEVLITIPAFGECTLLPLNGLPENFCTYENIRITAFGISLREFPELTHSETQEIWKCVAQKLSPMLNGNAIMITVWVSGVHLSYHEIEGKGDQVLTECISSLCMFRQFQDGEIALEIRELPVNRDVSVLIDEYIYCLFLGS